LISLISVLICFDITTKTTIFIVVGRTPDPSICYTTVMNAYDPIVLGIDAVKGDGFYTTFLFNFPSDGKFPVRVRTTADQGTARVLTRGGNRAFRLPTAVNGSTCCACV